METQGLETMTAREGREFCRDIRELMAAWDWCIKTAMAQGLTQSHAEDLVGRYFTRKFGKEG